MAQETEVLTNVAEMRCKIIEGWLAFNKDPDQLPDLVAKGGCNLFRSPLAYVTRKLTVNGTSYLCLRPEGDSQCQWVEAKS